MRLRLLGALKGVIVCIFVKVMYCCSSSGLFVFECFVCLYRMFKKLVSRVVGGNGSVFVVSDISFECFLMSIEGLQSDVFSV